ncbi:uncharacterized protein [Littorina saxatilis]|uniref:Uncharacterized protein n=1 Tax=Littorina saxatilis TaxID=31220 RepID=A0AAN9BDH5_9CAEN
MKLSRTLRVLLRSKGAFWLLIVVLAWVIIGLLQVGYPRRSSKSYLQTFSSNEDKKTRKVTNVASNFNDFPRNVHNVAHDLNHVAGEEKEAAGDPVLVSDLKDDHYDGDGDSNNVANDVINVASDLRLVNDAAKDVVTDLDDPVNHRADMESESIDVIYIEQAKLDQEHNNSTAKRSASEKKLSKKPSGTPGVKDANKHDRHIRGDNRHVIPADDVKHDVKGPHFQAKGKIRGKGYPLRNVKRKDVGTDSDHTGQVARPKSAVTLTAPNAARIKRHRRAILYSCNKITICGGWADRQKGVVSAYVLSVLLDRDFKLDMPRPCDVSVFLEPNKVDWVLRPEDVEQASSRHDVEGIDSHGYDLVNRMLKADDLQLPELDADIVYVTWNMELVRMLRKHRLAQRVPWLDPKVSLAEVYRHVLKALFKPTPHLQAKIDDMHRYRPPDTKLVCAQIRIGGSTDFSDTETFNSLQGVQNLMAFLRQYNDTVRYRILFASDNVQALNIGKQKFPETFMQSAGPITHVDRYKGHDACAGFGRAILDQVMLATCDVLVISESGLGKIAAFLRNTDDDLYLFHDSKVSVFRRDLRFPNRLFW